MPVFFTLAPSALKLISDFFCWLYQFAITLRLGINNTVFHQNTSANNRIVQLTFQLAPIIDTGNFTCHAVALRAVNGHGIIHIEDYDICIRTHSQNSLLGIDVKALCRVGTKQFNDSLQRRLAICGSIQHQRKSCIYAREAAKCLKDIVLSLHLLFQRKRGMIRTNKINGSIIDIVPHSFNRFLCPQRREQLRRFRESGVNRLSFGVQSLSDSQLKRLGRLHTAQEAVETVCAAAAAGFDNLSCDLMLALPGQTPEELEQTIREMTRLPIVHISAYLLKIEPGTPFARQQIAAQCPDEDAAADLYLQAVEQLNAAGFAQYEISNFAKPGFESRHNCKYWHCEPYLGIGPSAHSCWNGKRFFVPSSAASFLEQPVQTVETEDGAPCTLEERLMLGLRLTEGVPAAWLAEKKAAVERYCKLGFLRRTGDRVAFTPKGFLVSNTILAELVL